MVCGREIEKEERKVTEKESETLLSREKNKSEEERKKNLKNKSRRKREGRICFGILLELKTFTYFSYFLN